MRRVGTAEGRRAWRLALLLALCALLVRAALPAGWMPQASARGVTLGWCDGVTHVAPPEARALLDEALGKPKPAKPAPDQPCAFAAAAAPLASVELAALPAPREAAQAAVYQPLPIYPGRGLAAPPPDATGPPVLA